VFANKRKVGVWRCVHERRIDKLNRESISCCMEPNIAAEKLLDAGLGVSGGARL
jgi:hypothetical protein